MNRRTSQTTGGSPLSTFRTLIVCRGPIAMEALEVAAQMGMPRPHIIVSKREVYESAPAFAPWAAHGALFERLHVVEDYRDQDAILSIAKKNGLSGIYVGYGLNAENAAFIARCEEAELVPCAPPSSVMEFTASKFRAKQRVRDELGIRVLPGSDAAAALAMRDGVSDGELLASVEREVEKLLTASPGLVIRLKAVQSGGGKGQRLVHHPGQTAAAVGQIWAEISARGVNGDKGILVEANLSHPRHWEVQTFSDGETFVHFGARECSIQNSGSQKFIEVSLHPRQFDEYLTTLDARRDAALIGQLREEGKRVEAVCSNAVAIMRSLKYRGAATVEFLVAEDGGPEVCGKPHFMEINSRIQVEHRVSEAVSRVHGRPVRLVGEQFRIAAGEKLGYTQADISFTGYSTELRINTSNPNFLIGASGSVIERYHVPARSENFYYDDGGAVALFEAGRRRSWAVPNFDSNFGLAVMIGKGQTESFSLAEETLSDFDLQGNEQLMTTRSFHLGVLGLLGASAPYGKVRTDFSEIFLAFGALIHHALAKLKASDGKPGDPLHRLLSAALHRFKAEPGLAIAFAFAEKRMRKDGDGVSTGRLLKHLAKLIQFVPFAEEKTAMDEAAGAPPALVTRILKAVEDSRIHEFRRNDGDLEFFIPENVRDRRERANLTEELRDATVQGIVPRPLPAREVGELREILRSLGGKCAEYAEEAGLLESLNQTLSECLEKIPAEVPMPQSLFQALYDGLRRLKWSIRKGGFNGESEGLLLAEVSRAIKVARGPNVVAPLAGTIFLRPSPGKPNYVQPGDEIKESESVLALLENMKMFNEIRAHMSGRVKEICVENERPVLPGDILMVIE